MSEPLALIHLVSEQTMQNLLPLLALEPACAIQVRGAGAASESSDKRLVMATVQAGLKTQFVSHVIDSPKPAMDQVSEAVRRVLKDHPNAVVNITGGTKLMSLGAYLAATQAQVPILYCDTASRQFIFVNGNRNIRSFDDTVDQLNTCIVMAAHGFSPEDWKSDEPTTQLREFGRCAAEIRLRSDPQQFSKFIGELKKHFSPNGKPSPEIAPLIADSKMKLDYFQAAERAGLLRQVDDGMAILTGAANSHPQFLPVKHGSNSREKISINKELHRLLDGLWLELHVINQLRSNIRFADIQWSVQPATKTQDFGETDIVCVDRKTARLMVISCKSIPPSIEHFEALRQRAEQFGGSHVEPVLCIFDPLQRESECRSWAKHMDITALIHDAEISKFFAPAQQL